MDRSHRASAPLTGRSRGLALAAGFLLVVGVLLWSPVLGTPVLRSVMASPAAAQTAPTTTLVVAEQDQGGIIPKPNSGRAPEEPGDRGGSLQLALLAVIAVGVGAVFLRIAVAARRRNAGR